VYIPLVEWSWTPPAWQTALPAKKRRAHLEHQRQLLCLKPAVSATALVETDWSWIVGSVMFVGPFGELEDKFESDFENVKNVGKKFSVEEDVKG
jgi:hypothetical protein